MRNDRRSGTRSLARFSGRFMILVLAGVVAVTFAAPARSQADDALDELQRRAQEQLARERLEIFIEDTYEFYEITGELVSFRVRPDMTEDEIEAIETRSRQLDAQAGRLIAYVRDVAPYVRGRTDGLWIVLAPPDEDSTLEERLTLILALSNRISPKLDQLIQRLSADLGLTKVEEGWDMDVEAPFLIVGGLEELRSQARDLREAL
jgi:uncharacterized membrane-anchored protein